MDLGYARIEILVTVMQEVTFYTVILSKLFIKMHWVQSRKERHLFPLLC